MRGVVSQDVGIIQRRGELGVVYAAGRRGKKSTARKEAKEGSGRARRRGREKDVGGDVRSASCESRLDIIPPRSRAPSGLPCTWPRQIRTPHQAHWASDQAGPSRVTRRP